MVKFTSLSALLLSSAALLAHLGSTCVSAETTDRLLQDVSEVPSEVPSAAPSIACTESEDDEFLAGFRKKRGGKIPIIRTCGDLKGKGPRAIKRMCKKTISTDELDPANKVCKVTCDTCPKPSPPPSTKPPTDCVQDDTAEFFMKMTKRGVITRTCGWLDALMEKRRQLAQKLCKIESKDKDTASAYEVCVETCKTCKPPKPPTVSPAPSPAPKPCEENGDDEFILKKGKNDEPITATCEWLQELGVVMQGKICENTKSYMGFEPARDVCVVTCKNCVD